MLPMHDFKVFVKPVAIQTNIDCYFWVKFGAPK